MSKRTRAPKRRIERSWSRINASLTAAVKDIVLHTAEDAHTLVRTIIELKYQYINTAAETVNIGAQIELAPNAVKTVTPVALTTSLDNEGEKNALWSGSPIRLISKPGSNV